MKRIAGVFAAAALLVAACGSDDEVTAPGDTTTTTDDTVATTTTTTDDPEVRTCTNTEVGYTLEYPADWSVNDGSEIETCRAFGPGPDPVELEPATEPNVAIFIDLDDIDFATTSATDAYGDIESYDTTSVDGRRAVVVRHQSDEAGANGRDAHVWVVDLEGASLIAATRGPNDVVDERAPILDAMMRSLDFTEDVADDREAATFLGAFDGVRLAVTVGSGKVCVEPRRDSTSGARSCWTTDDVRATDVVFDTVRNDGEVIAFSGLAGSNVHRVIAGFEFDAAEGSLVTPVPETDLHAWAISDRDLALQHVIGYDDDGRMLTVLDADGAATEVFADVDTEPEDVDRSGDTGLLRDIATARHAGFDRIAFEFDDGVPGYDVSYEERPILEDASGREVEVAGDAVIVVRMSPAAAHETQGDDAEQTYTGPDRLAVPGLFSVEEIVQLGDFEGVLSYAIGVRAELPFRAIEVDNIVVIDVGHAGA